MSQSAPSAIDPKLASSLGWVSWSESFKISPPVASSQHGRGNDQGTYIVAPPDSSTLVVAAAAADPAAVARAGAVSGLARDLVQVVDAGADVSGPGRRPLVLAEVGGAGEVGAALDHAGPGVGHAEVVVVVRVHLQQLCVDLLDRPAEDDGGTVGEGLDLPLDFGDGVVGAGEQLSLGEDRSGGWVRDGGGLRI